MRSNLLRTILLLCICFFFVFQCQASFWLNIAQFQRVSGNSQQAISAFMRYLELRPNDQRIRKQMVEEFVQNGDYENARVYADSLISQFTDNNQDVELLLAIGNIKEAMESYKTANPSPFLSFQLAAKLVNGYLADTGGLPLPHAQATLLLGQALSLKKSSSELQLLGEEMMADNFWSTAIGQNVRAAIIWRIQTRSAGLMPANNKHASGVYATDAPKFEKIASMLKVRLTEIDLGEELAINGSFEQRIPGSDLIQGWQPSLMTTGNPWNRAVFVLGTDRYRAFVGERTLRIDGVVIEKRSDRESARAGFWLWDEPISMSPDTPYMISFVYRTDRMRSDCGVTLYLHFSDAQPSYIPEQCFLSTGGLWNRVTLILWNRNEQMAALAPLLRSFNVGSVWIDDFSVRAISLRQPVLPQDVLVQIDNIRQ